MSHNDIDPTPDEGTGDTTTGVRAVFRGDLGASAHSAGEAGLWGVEELSVGSPVLVVKRGPNTGTRFLLDQPVTSIGRNPDCDIYLDDITVSRRHAEFRIGRSLPAVGGRSHRAHGPDVLMTMSAPTGTVRRCSSTGSVAVSTASPDPDLAWLVATTSRGSYYADDAVVEDWPNIWPSDN